ncbi:AraC family transcriptional regulator [Embleya sp. AB8]|uniref:AraC family transcriptional regulator n=1 Tax=Embleya sp. AB8 TaxID=3156304 RepID=UPI003C717EE9
MNDPLDDLLRGVRANGAVLARSVLEPPCAMRFTAGAPLTLFIPLRGAGWIVGPGDGRPYRVGVGETAVVRGPEPFVFTDDLAALDRPELICDVCADSPPGAESPAPAAGRTVVLAGTYHVGGEVPQRLLRVLPPVAVVADSEDCGALLGYLEAQVLAVPAGRQIVRDRLLDWLLVCTLRDWFDRPQAGSPAWYRALGDDIVGTALRAVHAAPQRPWTLATLAAEAGVSRTTFAKRFHGLVGATPGAYLAEWRMTLAADLLTEPDATVAAVARRVGYADAFGFSAAFKRVRGVSPSAHRAGTAPAGAQAGAQASVGTVG